MAFSRCRVVATIKKMSKRKATSAIAPELIEDDFLRRDFISLGFRNLDENSVRLGVIRFL